MISESFTYSHTVALTEFHFGVLSQSSRILLKSLTTGMAVEFAIELLLGLVLRFEV